MKRLLFLLALTAAAAVWVDDAAAQSAYRRPPHPSGGPAYVVREQPGGYGYGYGYGVVIPQYRESPHEAEVRRIKAYHSRYRPHLHPRSLYQSPPSPYDYWGW